LVSIAVPNHREIIIKSKLTGGFMFAFSMLIQEAMAPITVPDNITVWGGLSLAMIFNLLVTVLRTLNIIKDDTATKKFLGGLLSALGAVVGLVFAFSTHVVDNIQIITLAAGGALAGFASVGTNSSYKHVKEGIAILRGKK
jgi:uncharacterized membrane protein